MPRRELDEVDFNHMHLPVKYRNPQLDLIQDDRVKSKVKSYLKNIRQMRKEGAGFLLFGPNGVGKTMALSILLRAFRMHGQSALYILATDIVESSIEGTIMEELGCKLWDYIRSVDVLLVDELGKEHNSKSGWSASRMENLFRARYSDNLVTLVSTNLRPKVDKGSKADSLEKRYKYSMLTVFGSSMYLMKMSGKDLRMGSLGTLPDFDENQ